MLARIQDGSVADLSCPWCSALVAATERVQRQRIRSESAMAAMVEEERVRSGLDRIRAGVRPHMGVLLSALWSLISSLGISEVFREVVHVVFTGMADWMPSGQVP